MNQAADSTTRSAGFLRKPALWLAVQILLLGVIFFAGWRSWEKAGSHWVSVAGGVMMGGSLVLAARGFRALGRSLGPGPLPQRNHVLVTRGVYSRIRHPLYTSMVLLAAGWAVFTHSWLAGAGTLLLFAILWLKASVEESLLREIYPEYTAYARKTGRFFPRCGVSIPRGQGTR